MSTQCLIVFENDGDAVVLQKRHDGYPECVLPLIEDFGRWYVKKVEETTLFPRLLWQPEDAAAALVYFSYVDEDRQWKDTAKELRRPSPDVKPIPLRKEEALSDASYAGEEYVYAIDLKRDLTWIIDVYEKRNSLKLLKTRKIDLARHLSRETLRQHPEFLRPKNPRVQALISELFAGDEDAEEDRETFARKLLAALAEALTIPTGPGYATTAAWYRVSGRRLEEGVITKAIRLAKNVRIAAISKDRARVAVPSERSDKEYEVAIMVSPFSFSCTCPWGRHRLRPCKHVMAAITAILEIEVSEDLLVVEESYITYRDFETARRLEEIHEALNRVAYLRARGEVKE